MTDNRQKWGINPIDPWFLSGHRNQVDHIEISDRCQLSAGFVCWCVLVFGIVAIAMTVPISAMAQKKAGPVELMDSPAFHQSVSGNVEFLLDGSRDRPVSEIANLHSGFQSIATPYLDVGLTPSRVWLRFSAINNNPDAGWWRIDIKRQYLKELDLYVVRDGEPLKILSHNESQPYDAREIPSRFLQQDFEIEAGETLQFYVGYRSSSTTFLPIFLAKPDGANQVHNSEANIDWALNGALAAMVLLSLLLIPVIGWRIGLSFGLYITAGMFYVANADGYTFQYLWPSQPWLNDPMNLVAILLMPATGLNFSRQLFDFESVTPAFDRFLKIFVCVVLFAAVLTLPLYSFRAFMVSAYSIVPVATLIQLASGIVAYRLGRVGSVPYILGAFLVVTSFVYATTAHLIPGRLDLDNTLDYGHFVLFMECVAFATAIMLRLLALRNERDRALAEALDSAEERLRLNEALMQSQKEYGEVKRLSEQRHAQLSNVSHDIRQPLISLRSALGRMRGRDEQVTEQMNAAFDYLEGIAVNEIALDGTADANILETGAQEVFPVRIVLDNVREIFAEDLEQKGKKLRYHTTDALVQSDPVALMRIVSNLMSNAIQHGGNKILLGVRKRRQSVRIEVWDDGEGLDPEELEKATKRHQKSEESTGDGLGLSIVSEMSEKLGLKFEFHSRKHRGSVAFVHVPVSK